MNDIIKNNKILPFQKRAAPITSIEKTREHDESSFEAYDEACARWVISSAIWESCGFV
jgi:hypothetical protein